MRATRKGRGINSTASTSKVNNFDDIAKDTLDEWIYFLKNEEIKDNFVAKGLMKAKQENRDREGEKKENKRKPRQ